jgi:hypothetical protein
MATKLTDDQIRAESQVKVRRALAKIQEAQNTLNDACSDLSTLCGGVVVWKATGKMADQTKALWYKVEAFRQKGRFKIDSLTIDAIERRSHASGS